MINLTCRLPLAISCINLSILLTKQLGLFNLPPSLDTTSLATMPVWSLANHPAFFLQLFNIIAEETFLLFHPGEAYFLQFTPLLQAISTAMSNTLRAGVASIEAFRQRFGRETAKLRKSDCGQGIFQLLLQPDQFYRTTDLLERNTEKSSTPSSLSCVEQNVAIASREEEGRMQSEFAPFFTLTPQITPTITNYIFTVLQNTLHLATQQPRRLFVSSPGMSVSKLLDRARGIKHTVLIVSDGHSRLCGSYHEQPWRYTSTFYNEGNSLVFRAYNRQQWGEQNETRSTGLTNEDGQDWQVDCFPLFRKDSFVRVSTEAGLVVGGGGRYAISLDSRLRWGSSGECTSFRSPCLMGSSDFLCSTVELWELVL